MEEKNLVICIQEFRYASILADNISEKEELALKVYTFTNASGVLKFMEQKRIHILIVDETWSYDERNQMIANQVYVLTTECCKDLGKDEKEILKYQSTDRILQGIFEHYCSRDKETLLKGVKKGKADLFAVYSPIHRIGKTTFALELGRELSQQKKVLYLNLETYAGYGVHFTKSEGRSLGDLFYFIRQGNGSLPLRITTLVEHIGKLDYISPFEVATDLQDVMAEEWVALLKQLLEESHYETVILDMGEAIQGMFSILNMCDKIYMPVLDDDISCSKIRQYEDSVRCLFLDSVLERTVQISANEDLEETARIVAREEK